LLQKDEEARAPPDWANQFLQNSHGRYVPPAERRTVVARRAEAPVKQEAPQYQQVPSTTHKNYVGMPNNKQSMANSQDNREFFNFIQERMSTTDHTTGAFSPLAGTEFKRRA
jgi:hypothetical protein